MNLDTWAARHHISAQALAELRAIMLPPDVSVAVSGASEAAVSNLVRLEASRLGGRLWRNNVGAGKLENGSFVRWGLANDSAALNARCKSADLIGIRPVLITPAHIGKTIGQFMSREVKAVGWKWRATEREKAQGKWADMINALGGDACFTTGEGTL